MTTTYTSGIGVTTANQHLDDIYVTSGGGTCINVYNNGTGLELSNFELASSPDSLILNQLHSLTPGIWVHDGKIHHCTHGFSYGTHGIYDKGNGTLLERVEIWDIAGGQAFSPRWPNRIYRCIGRNTPDAVGHFNYGTQGGILKIRECRFFAITEWIFYSEGIWYDNNDTNLGPSTVSIEFDHCTIDVTQCAGGGSQAFNFSQCHADQYVTNCIIISNLTLSQIIRGPSGYTVHTDGTIVLTPAQAATWLSAAPYYVPVAGSGSPIIGHAVGSPPGCLAAWGNVSDVGAIQTTGGGGGGTPATYVGKNTVGTSLTAAGNGMAVDLIRANKWSLANSLTITGGHAFIVPTAAGTQKIRLAIYRDVPSAQATLVAVSNEVIYDATSGSRWVDFPLPASVNLTADNYWIAIWTGGTAGVAGFAYDTVTGSRQFGAATYATATNPPSPYPTGSSDDLQMSIYFDATVVLTNTVAPAISGGSPVVGTHLTVSDGTWTGPPTSFTYQWKRDNHGNGVYANVVSGTGNFYNLSDIDDACHIYCEVTAHAGAASLPANSNVILCTEPVPVNTAAPVASGSPTVGSVLGVTNGSWSNLLGYNPIFDYQWQRDNLGDGVYTDIVGDTAPTRTVSTVGIGCNIRCRVGVTNSGGRTTAVSNSIGPIISPVPSNTTAPLISGAARVGVTLSVDTGTWTGTVTGYTYQWQRDNSGGGTFNNIGGATSSTYLLVSADEGCQVRCRVTALSSAGNVTASSNAIFVFAIVSFVHVDPVRNVGSRVGKRAYAALEPITGADAAAGYPLQAYVMGLARSFETIADLVETGDNGEIGWSSILDIDRIPEEAIFWLAQFVGVRLNDDLSYPDQRARVKNTDGWSRGTPGAMAFAASQYLIGTKRVTIRERYNPTSGLTNAYHMQVITKTSETPDASRVLAALKEQKPAGIILHLNNLDGLEYQGLFSGYANYQAVYTSFATYQGVYMNVPGT